VGETVTEGIVARHCGICGYGFPDPVEASAQPADSPCPECGGHCPVFTVQAADAAEFHDFVQGAKGKRPGEKKPYIETQAGDQFSPARARFMDKYRRIDRDNDRYDEVVMDPETGEIVHECHEPLTEHWGHGSAKTTRQESPSEG
jgi:hypothetical protein